MNGIIEIILALLALFNAQGEQTAAYEVPPPPAPAVQVAVPEPAPEPEPPCRGTVIEIWWLEVEGYSPSPMQGDRVDTGLDHVSEIRADVVGDFLWFQFDRIDNPDSTADDIRSVFIEPGTESIEICKP